MNDIEKICNQLIDWLKDRVKDANAKGLIFGLSGGIDSAVVAALSKKAFPDTSLGIIMPCHSDPKDEEHALLVADSINLETKKVDLSEVYDVFLDSVNIFEPKKLAQANIKPRLRMTTLYCLAQQENYLVVGSTNRSEFEVGYFTKHADSGVDILPIASFVKDEIKQLARYLNIPEIIITKPPTAGLWEKQTDEKEMGFSYDILDNYIKTGDAPSDIKQKIITMNKNSQHKRKFPPVFYYNK